jgi:hypothetical protein
MAIFFFFFFFFSSRFSFSSCSSEDPCFAVVSTRKEGQRYQTKNSALVAAEAVWKEHATFTLESTASWFDIHVFSLAGTLGGPVLVGCVRIPVFGFREAPSDCEFELRDVRIVPSLPVCGRVRLRVSASHIASRTHLAATRGVAVQALPVRLNTGDLVFFKTTRVLTFFTRLLSWSDYDHVGIVLVSSNGKLRLLEAVSEPGVVVVDLEKALGNYKSTCSELAALRFVFDRDDKTEAVAALFAREVRGMEYNWNLLDMALTSSEEPKELKGMFCSQLVAAALKKLSVLPPNVVADNYLPGTLSSPQLVVEKHVTRDPLVRFVSWNGEGIERQFEARKAPFGKHEAVLNAAWKGRKANEKVLIVDTDENGFLVCDDGSQVPSAFVDLN